MVSVTLSNIIILTDNQFNPSAMESLIHVLLFSGLTQSISCQYILIQEQKSWDEAQVYCRQNYMDLATVQSNEDWTHLQETNQPATTLVWTGLYNDINSWRWSYKDENLTLTFWRSGEPNNSGGKEEFVFLMKQGGTWCDLYSTASNTYFCYDVTENKTGANVFIFYNFSMSWHNAQSYCRQHHTDLAIIRSKAENDLLSSMMQGFNKTWIGLFRDSWKWSDGTNISTSSIKWMSTTRDITGQNRPCGAAGPDGLIDDRLCSDALPFICMHHPKKQIMRLEVKSDQNVNDPAVMETILQWIKQKLKDRGIEKNTRVRWRLQSDGNIFTPKHDWEDGR